MNLLDRCGSFQAVKDPEGPTQADRTYIRTELKSTEGGFWATDSGDAKSQLTSGPRRGRAIKGRKFLLESYAIAACRTGQESERQEQVYKLTTGCRQGSPS